MSLKFVNVDDLPPSKAGPRSKYSEFWNALSDLQPGRGVQWPGSASGLGTCVKSRGNRVPPGVRCIIRTIDGKRVAFAIVPK